MKEQRWLPHVAPHLPLRVPAPVAVGEPDEVFPYPWAVVEWLPGELARLDTLDDPVRAAVDLGNFVNALASIDTASGYPSVPNRRAGPVRHSDAMVRSGLAGLQAEVDAAAVEHAWARVLATPDYDGSPVWFHGDLMSFNLLASEGRLTAVIDWGTCGVGDPAIDTIIAWTLLPPEARRVYRHVLGVDDATWTRGTGWVLEGVYGIVYYRDTNAEFAAHLVRGIEAVLADLS
jgi:aminoglycoside phosphotransferase (APT) family kinase protein